MKATLLILEGSDEEVMKAVRAVQEKPAAEPVATVISNHKANGEEQHSAVIWTMKRAEAFYKWLYGDQQKLINFLLEEGGRATMSDIMKHLGMKKGNQLAGIRSCITRNARRETSYKEAEVIEWEKDEDSGKWCYQLVPEVHSLLKQIAGKQKGK